MMTGKIQLIIALFLIIGLLAIVNMIRKRKLDLKYALSWLAAILFVLMTLLIYTRHCIPLLGILNKEYRNSVLDNSPCL